MPAKTIGVGGDFFLFHPLPLRSGSYISNRDFTYDRVVLDEELSWALFGSYDVAGQTVWIQNEPYVVAGVVSREKDKASGKAYADGAGMFISYSAMRHITGGEENTDPSISCYELVMAEPITGFGLRKLRFDASMAYSTLLSASRSGRKAKRCGMNPMRCPNISTGSTSLRLVLLCITLPRSVRTMPTMVASNA